MREYQHLWPVRELLVDYLPFCSPPLPVLSCASVKKAGQDED
jgi:hypothetical protein